MKKILLGLGMSALALFTLFGVVSAKVETVPGPWELTAPNPIVFTCGGTDYNHTLLDVNNDSTTGDFSGNGWYDPNHSYTWDITGNVSDDDITFTLIYTGTNPGYTLNGEGTIAPDGSISGTTDGNCQFFAMPADTAVRFEGNHGQYVSSQENKQEAAQSRVGMPEQSKGHTQ